jgi:hypothetical protein
MIITANTDRGVLRMTSSRICMLVAALAVAGCNSSSEPETVAVPAAPAASVQKPATPVDPVAKMAKAVGGRKPGAAVDLRYDIDARPAVGVSTEVEVAFVPSAGVDALEATISGMDGITLAGNLKPRFEKVEPGKPYSHAFSLLPDRAGVFYVTVVVNTEIGGSSIGRTFSIPFVVGNAAPAEKTQPQQDSTGQAIQPMKAAEPKN